MSKKIYNLVYYDEDKKLHYIHISDFGLKKVILLENKAIDSYNLETIDNITSFYSEDVLRKILNIEDNGNFLIISKENNTYQKKCVLFDDRELYTLTDNIIFDDDYNLRSVTDALKEKNFVKFLDEESKFYTSYNQKMSYLIHKLNCIYSLENEDFETEIEKNKLISLYSDNIDNYLKYRDFYFALREYEDKGYIKKNNEKIYQILLKAKEIELENLEQSFLLDELTQEHYMFIKSFIIDEINRIKDKSYKIEKTKKRIIKK